MTPSQVRTIRMSATRVDEHDLEVVGHLLDERPGGTGVDWLDDGHGSVIHDMTLTIRVRHPELVIQGVGGTMTQHPYTLCPDALPPLQRLVGRPAALLGAALLAISPWHIWASRTSDPWIAATLLATVTLWLARGAARGCRPRIRPMGPI